MVTAVIGGTISDRLSDGVANTMFAVLLVFVAITQLLLACVPDRRPITEPIAPSTD